MKRSKRKISHIFGLLLTYTALLVWLAVNNTSFYSLKSHKDTSEKANSKPKTKKTAEKSEQILQEFSVEAVVSMVYFNLDYSYQLILSLDFPIIENTHYSSYEQARPRISYLEKTFEHHIAINAP